MRSTFCVLFYLKRKDVRKDGTVPVMGRITIDGGKPAQFSCKMTVAPSLWNTETGRMTGRSVAAQEANKMLDGIRVKINNHYREIVDRDGFVTAEKVKNAFLGLEYRHETLLKVYEQFNSDFDKLVYNPQIQISVVSGTKRSIFRQKNKTKRSKKRLHTTLIKPEQKVNEDLCSGFIVS